METKITNIGWETTINQGKCITVMTDNIDDNDMKVIKIEVEHDDFGTPYIHADKVTELLQILAKEAQEHPLQNLYVSDAYNY